MNQRDSASPPEPAEVKAVWHTPGQKDSLRAVATRDDRRAHLWSREEGLGTGGKDAAANAGRTRCHAGPSQDGGGNSEGFLHNFQRN